MRPIIKYLLPILTLFFLWHTTLFATSFEVQVSGCSPSIFQYPTDTQWENAHAEQIEKLYRDNGNSLTCMWIRIILNGAIEPNSTLFLDLEMYSQVKAVYLDTLTLFKEADVFASHNRKQIPQSFFTLSLPPKTDAKYLYIKLENQNNEALVLPDMSIKNQKDIFFKLFFGEFAFIFVSFVLIIIAAVSASQIKAHLKKRRYDTLFLVVATISGSLFNLMYSGGVRFYVDFYWLWTYVSILALFGVNIGLYGYFEQLVSVRQKVILQWLWKIHFVVALGLLLFNITGFIKLHPLFVNDFYIALFSLSLILLGVVLVIAIVQSRYTQRLIIYSGTFLCFAIAIDLLDYFDVIMLDTAFFPVGCIVFIIALIWQQILLFNTTNTKIEQYAIELQYKSLDLENAFDKLEKTNLLLERKVAERTKKLNDKNKLLTELNQILSDSEIKYHQLADTLLEGVVIHNEGKILEVNKGFSRITNYQAEQISGRQFIDIVHAEYRVELDNYIREKKDQNLEIDILRSNGARIRVEITGKTLLIGEKTLGVIAVRNITEQYRSSEALRRNKEQLTAIFSNAAVGIVVINKEGKYMQYNRKWAEMLGFDDRELYMQTYHDIVYASDRFTHTSQREVSNFMHYERRFMRKDGTYFWGEVWPSLMRYDGTNIDGFIEIIIDITHRKTIQEELRMAENQYRGLFESSPVGIFRASLNNRFIDINPVLAQMLGYNTAEDLIGRENDLLKQINETFSNKMFFQQNIQERGEISNFEYIYTKYNDEQIWLSINLKTQQSRIGEMQIHGFVTDISARKQAEDVLLLYRQGIAYSPFYIIITDNRGHINQLSPSFAEKFKCKAEDVAGKHISTIWGGNTDYYRQKFKTILIEEEGETDLSVMVQQVPIRLHASIRPYEKDGFVGYYFIYLEETLRTTSLENFVLSSESILQLVMRHTNICTAFLDSSLTFIYASAAFARLMGKQLSQILGKQAVQIFTSPGILQNLETALEGSEVITTADFLYMGTKEPFDMKIVPELDATGRVGSLFILINIGQMTVTQQDCLIAKTPAIDILQAMNTGICILNAEKKVVWGNNVFFQIAGYSHEELLNRSYKFLFDLDREFDESRPENVYKTMAQIHCSDNSYRNVELAVMHLPQYNIYQVSVSPAEDKVQMRLQLRDAYTALTRANKLRSHIISNLSYEMRTPLNVIMGFSDMLEVQLADAQQKIFLEAIRSGAQNVLSILSDILDLSQIESGKLKIKYQTTNLSELFEHIVNKFGKQLADSSVKFVPEISADLPQLVFIDKSRLNQIITNLMSNAVKFTTTGKIILRIQRLNFSPQENPEKVDILIEVEDTGIGIANDAGNEIFDIFSDDKVNSRSRSKGMGLPIVKRLTQMLGGHLYYSSSEGKGSKFSVELYDIKITKLKSERQALPTNFIVSPAKINFEPSTVLLVEDIEANIHLVGEILRRSAINLLVARSGNQAINILESQTPSLVLLDIQLPDIDGVEVARIIRNSKNKKLKEVPIIVFTASIISERSMDYLEVNINGYLQKPITQKDFYKELMRFLPYTTVAKEPTADDDRKTKIKANPAVLPAAVAKIDSQLLPMWQKVSLNYRMRDIGMFSNEARMLGESAGIPLLKDFGEKLFHYVNRQDIDNLILVLGSFPDIVLRLKAQLQEVEAKRNTDTITPIV